MKVVLGTIVLGGFGRWAFLEITDLWKAKAAIREFIAAQADDG